MIIPKRMYQKMSKATPKDSMGKEVCGDIASKALMLATLDRLVEGKVVVRRAVNAIRNLIENSNPDTDTEGVDEEISKWIDENIRMNELTIVEDYIYADEAQKEIDILRRIKQLLQQQPRKRDVTREWIRETSRALFSESVYPLEPGGSSTTKMAEKLEEKITELGFEVEE